MSAKLAIYNRLSDDGLSLVDCLEIVYDDEIADFERSIFCDPMYCEVSSLRDVDWAIRRYVRGKAGLPSNQVREFIMEHVVDIDRII